MKPDKSPLKYKVGPTSLVNDSVGVPMLLVMFCDIVKFTVFLKVLLAVTSKLLVVNVELVGLVPALWSQSVPPFKVRGPVPQAPPLPILIWPAVT
ncbi:MAG: hypothetical protein ABSA77_06720, partial [Thermoguttaceae bacterium]